MLIEVKEKHSPPGDRKPGTIVAANGDKFDAWQEVFAVLRVGMQYEVEVKDRQWNGRTFLTIKKATPAGSAPGAGFAREPGAPAAAPASALTAEQEFVRDILVAYIGNGRCDPERLTEIVQFIRNAYNIHWGPIPYRDAAE